ncbi:uncharacterized protein LOC143428753 isoform X2 [Xylocopa sonorina]|uniref:uncharacterized protein LOC143428753 isoform X2 n=1 Tax=Xylocopa sonorina TaxID=1818115 RepID=UPI00403B2D33
MEISKSLQEEILTVQNKLKNAIRDHQNTDILGQIQKIHLHIVSLGRCQKQVVQRLRKEVETFKAENANGAKVSIASLLGLNNNNHITNNNETKHKTDGNDFTTKSSKEDYEEIVRNGDVPSPTRHRAVSIKERPSSVETISGEDDVIEVSMDENSNEKSEKEEPKKECKVDSTAKMNFLNALGLITTTTCAELQNKRAERKRRSTANPQFVYSSLEVPTKRKRHSYLQSGNVPQTRQTTARMNGPSPPPVKVAPPKPASPPTSRTVMKSLIPVQKSTTRPNILRNVAESKVFPSKTKVENGPSQIQLPVPTVKTVQSIGNKAVHIPGLPSSLTIERISSDSAVCISCRNPGTLTVCENCASNYHVSCHSVSPAPPRICPKCALIEEEEIDDGEDGEEEDEGRPPFKKDEEFATATHAPGIIRKAREDAEIYKTASGLHKVDATQKKRGFSSSIGISQLPSSTFLIPISSNSVPTSTVNQSDVGASATISSEHRESSVPYSSIVLNQLARSSIAYVDRTEPQVSYAYQLPVTSVQSDKHQSYLIVKKITEPAARRASQSSEDQSHASMLNCKLPTTSGYSSCVQTEISVANVSSMLIGNQLPDLASRNRKKQTNRAVPALNRIIDTENLSITAEYQLERSTFNGRKSRARQPRNKFGINQLRSARATDILLPSHDSAEPDKQLQIAKSSEPEETTLFGGRPKYRARTGGFLHSLFTSHNKSYILTDNSREPRDVGPANKDTSADRQQLYHQGYQLESGERNEPTVQSQRGALTKFFEHVKLEEAHIPAPSRAKLVQKRGTSSKRSELEVTEIADEIQLPSPGTFEEDFTIDRGVKLEEAHAPPPSRAKLVYKGGTSSEGNELEVTEITDEMQLPSTGTFEDDFAIDRGAKLEETCAPTSTRVKLVYKRGTSAKMNELEVTEITDEVQLPSSSTFEDDFTIDRGAKLEETYTPASTGAKQAYKRGTSSKRDEVGVTEIVDEGRSSSPTTFGDDFWHSIAEGLKSNTPKNADSYDSYERKCGNTYARVGCEPEDDEKDDNASTDATYTRHIESLAEIVPENRRDRQDSASLCNAQSNYLELRNEVSVPDDKADSERQDLSSGRRSTSSSSSSSSSSTSDSDTPEQAMSNSVKYSRRRLTGNEYKERLGINAVSPESMQVLEQFESAMLETGCSNAATC